MTLSSQLRYTLITGAAGGIGRALVRAFPAAYYGVIVTTEPSTLRLEYLWNF